MASLNIRNLGGPQENKTNMDCITSQYVLFLQYVLFNKQFCSTRFRKLRRLTSHQILLSIVFIKYWICNKPRESGKVYK